MQENIDFGKHEKTHKLLRPCRTIACRSGVCHAAYGKYQSYAGIRWHTLGVRWA